ncbi:hypothetical protein ZIOFF_048831 [Zingiber officinale]|uniref:Protein ENHANCED DISEASE RESISTANCE 2 C-terminal domain-containing protein n=1 Tax=Zingiber officinale TaxID=94328 RepID=A0A8J5FQA2_ZINOF|nr:hypothetical protein ZIOFF_048831 [Zingiber officinale]
MREELRKIGALETMLSHHGPHLKALLEEKSNPRRTPRLFTSWGKDRYGVLPRSAKVRYERSVLVDALHLDPLMSDYRIDVEIGSSSVARSIISLVIGYITSIVVDLAILIEAKEENELPEYILGTVRLNQVRLESAVPYWGES